MAKDFDDISKKIDQSQKIIKELDNNQDKILTDISSIKQQLSDINVKVDIILEILNSFTIMLSEESDESSEDYLDNESWIPEQEENWNSYEDEEDNE